MGQHARSIANEILLLTGNDGGGDRIDGRETEQDDGVIGVRLDSLRVDAMKKRSSYVDDETEYQNNLIFNDFQSCKLFLRCPKQMHS